MKTLRRRILMPFVGLVAAVVVGTTAVALVLVSNAVEHRIAAQMSDLSHFISRSEGKFPIVPPTLQHMRGAFNADIVIARDKAIWRQLSTIDQARARRVIGATHVAPVEGGAVERVRGDDFDFLVVVSPVVIDKVNMELYVLLPSEVVAAEKRRALGPLVAVGAAGLVLALAIAAGVASAVSRPIEALAAEARTGKPLDVGPSAPREVAELGRALNDRMDAVARAERMAAVGRMAAMMAHEIRNPLAALKMNAQLLESRAEPWAREHAARLLAEIERLSRAIDDLVDAGRPSPPKPEWIELDRLVADVVDQLRPRLDHWKARVTLDTSPAKVHADARRLKSALTNLIVNAAQSMPQGGPVKITMADGARVTIEDRGGGVPESMRPRLFEPFVTTREDGMGLGLAVAKTFVEECGGSVGYEPAEGGSRFWIELPTKS